MADIEVSGLLAGQPDTEAVLPYVNERLLRWRRRTDGPLIILAIGSLPFLVLELARSELPAIDELFLDLVNVFVFVVFLANYLVEVSLASDRRSFVRHEWLAGLIVVTQALAVVPALGVFGVLRGARAARAVRAVAVLARLFAIGGLAARDGRQVLRRYAARLALGAAAFTWLTSAVAFTLVEDVGERQRVNSFFDALWWSTTTITTVGYGDVYPITAAGRIIAAITMVVGISTFAVLTATVASFLVRDPLPDA